VTVAQTAGALALVAVLPVAATGLPAVPLKGCANACDGPKLASAPERKTWERSVVELTGGYMVTEWPDGGPTAALEFGEGITGNMARD
jgi:hypothetical protein